MFDQSSFMQDINLLSKGLGVESLRRKVISDNIANANVPHFRRSEVNFESQLRRALDAEKKVETPFYRTHQNHIPLKQSLNHKQVQPRVNLDYLTGYHNNGNNVDPDKEITLAAKNQMRYILYLQHIDQHYRMINGSMRAAI